MKRYLFILILFTIFLVPISRVSADTAAEQFTSGIKTTATGAGYDGADATDPDKVFTDTITSIIKAILSMVGLVFLLLMIYGGYRWMMARGNDADVQSAKNIIINAVIGLIIVMAAYAITQFVGKVVIINNPPVPAPLP